MYEGYDSQNWGLQKQGQEVLQLEMTIRKMSSIHMRTNPSALIFIVDLVFYYWCLCICTNRAK